MKNFSTLKKYAELAWSAYGDFGDKNPLKKILEDISIMHFQILAHLQR